MAASQTSIASLRSSRGQVNLTSKTTHACSQESTRAGGAFSRTAVFSPSVHHQRVSRGRRPSAMVMKWIMPWRARLLPRAAACHRTERVTAARSSLPVMLQASRTGGRMRRMPHAPPADHRLLAFDTSMGKKSTRGPMRQQRY